MFFLNLISYYFVTLYNANDVIEIINLLFTLILHFFIELETNIINDVMNKSYVAKITAKKIIKILSCKI